MISKKLKAAAAALALALSVGTAGAIATAPAANAYTWTSKYQSKDGTYWAYKVCTREEWFNGCNSGWYTSKWHWMFWG